jgi:hypothetical protein
VHVSFVIVFLISVFLVVQPQAEVKSFPEEPIKALAANREGTYIVGGGVSGNILLWEVNSHFSNLLTLA